jgi:hypothetical protein
MATAQTYRGIFTCTTGKETWLALDFFAETRALAVAHAAHVAGSEPREWGPLRLVKVVPLSPWEMIDAGAWRPIAPPSAPIWGSGRGRRRC